MQGHGRQAARKHTAMGAITRHGFLAATHGSFMQQGVSTALLLARQAAAAWDTAEERRIMAQVEPRLRDDAGLERFNENGRG